MSKRLLIAGITLVLASTAISAAAKPPFLVDAEWLEEHIEDPELVLLEVRYHPHRYHTVSQQRTDPSTHEWSSRSELEKLYADIPKDKSIIVYCHDGFRSAQAYLQLKYLGYPDVRVLNGGWGYWGNAMTLPVVEGRMPYDEEFELQAISSRVTGIEPRTVRTWCRV